MKTLLGGLGIAALLLLPLTAAADATITVQVTNNQPAGGFTFSPLWHALHDGTFDMFNAGSPASLGIENLAELANGTELGNEFASSGATGQVGTLASPDAVPPFTPGETNWTSITTANPAVERYFSFAAMVVPSNDLFIGNDNPLAWEVFDAAGNFNGPLTIEIYGRHVWDAGTEVNDIDDGGAFIVGSDATLGTTENGVVMPFFDRADAGAYIASLVGRETPAYTLTDGLTSGELLATITITPEPASLLGLALTGLLVLRRR